MQFQWKPSLSRAVAAVMFAVAATSSAYALPKGPCDKSPEPCCDEPKAGPFAFNYPMDLGIACPRDFYVHVDGLAFQAKQDGMEFAIRDSSAGASASAAAPLTNGEFIGFDSTHSDWDYNPGMRFGVGTYMNHDAWNVDFNWTWVNITNYKLANATSSGSGLIPLWMLGSGTTPTTSTISTGAVWKASYNVLDAQLGKPYNVSRYFVCAPHFGVRAAWIDQHFSVRYGSSVTQNSTTVTNPIHHGDNDFWGFGARAGFDTDWIIGKGWCLFANVSGSMIFGKFDVEQNLDPSSNATDGMTASRQFYQNVPNMEMALGLGWNQSFDSNRYRVSMRAAYEFIEWFDQLNMRKFYSGTAAYANDVVSRGNLTLNGFSLRLQLDI